MTTIEITGNWNADLIQVFPDEYDILRREGHKPSRRKARKTLLNFSESLIDTLIVWQIYDLFSINVDGKYLLSGKRDSNKRNGNRWTLRTYLFKFSGKTKLNLSDSQLEDLTRAFKQDKVEGWRWLQANTDIEKKIRFKVK